MEILREPELVEKLRLSRATIWAMAKAGTFPKPIRIGANAVGWLKHEVEAWLQERIAQRDGEAA